MANSTTRPSLETKAEEERDSETQAKADRMPTKDEEDAAEGAEDQLDESGAMKGVETHAQEMMRLGRDVKGEGRIT